ncbi:hypothetical protein EG329_003640 [Mollisiaceae sp. DMI_Dod_QoI]|nr:hypothetical protein EG329_003640 [Helotiales sp. DMI_Dod_QoI]
MSNLGEFDADLQERVNHAIDVYMASKDSVLRQHLKDTRSELLEAIKTLIDDWFWRNDSTIQDLVIGSTKEIVQDLLRRDIIQKAVSEKVQGGEEQNESSREVDNAYEVFGPKRPHYDSNSEYEPDAQSEKGSETRPPPSTRRSTRRGAGSRFTKAREVFGGLPDDDDSDEKNLSAPDELFVEGVASGSKENQKSQDDYPKVPRSKLLGARTSDNTTGRRDDRKNIVGSARPASAQTQPRGAMTANKRTNLRLSNREVDDSGTVEDQAIFNGTPSKSRTSGLQAHSQKENPSYSDNRRPAALGDEVSAEVSSPKSRYLNPKTPNGYPPSTPSGHIGATSRSAPTDADVFSGKLLPPSKDARLLTPAESAKTKRHRESSSPPVGAAQASIKRQKSGLGISNNAYITPSKSSSVGRLDGAGSKSKMTADAEENEQDDDCEEGEVSE